MISRLHKSNPLPKVYLAGKISKHCWRHTLVSHLREHSWDDGPLEQFYFCYVGPFFVGCDHGCYHRPENHGCFQGCSPDCDIPKYEITGLCYAAIRKAQLVFCYITSKDCFGTLVEIGVAHALGIPVVIAFAPGIACEESNEMWFACAGAVRVKYDVTEYSLNEVFDSALRRYT